MNGGREYGIGRMGGTAYVAKLVLVLQAGRHMVLGFFLLLRLGAAEERFHAGSRSDVT